MCIYKHVKGMCVWMPYTYLQYIYIYDVYIYKYILHIYIYVHIITYIIYIYISHYIHHRSTSKKVSQLCKCQTWIMNNCGRHVPLPFLGDVPLQRFRSTDCLGHGYTVGWSLVIHFLAHFSSIYSVRGDIPDIDQVYNSDDPWDP